MSLWELKKKPIPLLESFDDVPLAQEGGEALVDITEISPRIHFDASYLKKGLKGALDRCYVRETVKDMLLQVLSTLPEEYGILIFDTLRPVSVQQDLFDSFWADLEKEHPHWDESQMREAIDTFVAVPRIDYQRPAPHTTGGAVDLTFTFCGKPLLMGTDFDDFTPRAGTRWLEENAFSDEEKEARDNRRLLYHSMIQAGFVNYWEEWWHYSYGDRAWGRRKGVIPFYSYIEAPKTERIL